MATSGEVDMQDAGAVAELFDRAAEANGETAGRTGSVVDLPDKGRLVVTGDLHDHQENYEAAVKLSRINYSENYHLLLQEVIHGEHLVNGMDFSYRTLGRVAELKTQKPDQVHLILSNHELAQTAGEGILKEGVSVVEAFDAGLDYIFGDEADRVHQAIRRFIGSLPLALRCANGVFCAHALPSAQKRDSFDPDVITRKLTEADRTGPDGSAYLMVWGRGWAQTTADELAERWGVRLFVLGHEYAEMGWDEVGESMLVINSDHEHGAALPIDLSEAPTRDQLIEQITPLKAVG